MRETDNVAERDSRLGTRLAAENRAAMSAIPQDRAVEIMRRALEQTDEPRPRMSGRWVAVLAGAAAAALAAAVVVGVGAGRDNADQYLPADTPSSSGPSTPGEGGSAATTLGDVTASPLPASFPQTAGNNGLRAVTSTGERLTDPEMDALHTQLATAITDAGTVRSLVRRVDELDFSAAPDLVDFTYEWDFRDPSTPRHRIQRHGVTHPETMIVAETVWTWSEDGPQGQVRLGVEEAGDTAWFYTDPVNSVLFGYPWQREQGDAVWRLPDENGLARYRLVNGRLDGAPLNPTDSRNVVDLWVDPATGRVTSMVYVGEGSRTLVPRVDYGVDVSITPPAEPGQQDPLGPVPQQGEAASTGTVTSTGMVAPTGMTARVEAAARLLVGSVGGEPR